MHFPLGFLLVFVTLNTFNLLAMSFCRFIMFCVLTGENCQLCEENKSTIKTNLTKTKAMNPKCQNVILFKHLSNPLQLFESTHTTATGKEMIVCFHKYLFLNDCL